MIRRKNLLSLLTAVVMLGLSLLLMSLPVYQISSEVKTKKSSNTFIGDEKYHAAMAEVREAAETYEAQGIETEITEETVERVNSKGETTSLLVLRLKTERHCTGWDFIRTGFPTGRILILMLCMEAAALILALAGSLGGLDLPWRDLKRKTRLLRQAGAFCMLTALVMAPVFVMATNATINRQIGLYAQGLTEAPPESVLRSADQLIYGGFAGENIADLLKTASPAVQWVWWVQLPVLFCGMTALILLAKGTCRRVLLRGALYFSVVIICVVILYPYIVMATSAFRTDAEANDVSFLHLFPTEWRWENFTYILGRGVPRYLLNSLLLATGATVIALACGIPAAYAMARMRFRGRKLYMGFVIMSQMFSPVVLLVGISRLMMDLRMNDTLLGLTFINAAFNQAFAIWLLRGTFISISPEMEQAACIDGCNTVSALIRVLLPMAAPGIVTTLIFVFINAWNEYTISTVVINSDLNRPITVGLTQFAAFSMIQWNYLFMSSLLATIPVVILFMLIEKHLVSGLTSGGVKG